MTHAYVETDRKVVSSIQDGMLVLAGIGVDDNKEDIEWLTRKILQMRIFNDANGIPNLSLSETGGDILLVSQFTLLADTKKGNRPSYIGAASPEIAKPLFEILHTHLQQGLGKVIPTGIFGARMKVELVNDGPFTIIIDSRKEK